MPNIHRPQEGNERQGGAHSALAAVLMKQNVRLWPRFLAIYARLSRLPRGWRRRFYRKTAATKVATTLAGIALLLALGRTPVGQVAFALDIDVDDGVVIVDDTDEQCSLREAIINANNGGQTYDDCGPGSPYADTIRLPPNGNFTIESSFAYATGLPPITSKITIEGDGSTIHRDPNNANPFRLLAVSSSGDLTLNELNLSGGLVSGGGGAIAVEGTATITNSTISGSTAVEGGGVHSGNNSIVTITNSTISGNTATLQGGGIDISGGNVTLNNSTVTGNTAVEGLGGGGIFLSPNSTVTLNRSIVSGNNAPYGREVGLLLFGTPGKVYADNFNILGEKSSTNAQAFYNFYPGASDITATSNGTTPTYLSAILHPTLAANGGPTKTHALVANSPAIDKAPDAACTAAPVNGQDQRGEPRNENGDGSNSPNECDIGAFEGFIPRAIYMTAAGPGTTGDGLNFGKEDILELIEWESGAWDILFDGVDAGLTTKHDINAIHVNAADDLYLSFFQNKIKTANLGTVLGHDILHYDGSSFSLFFDGSDVGLTTVGEKVDALHILDGSFAPVGGCDYYLLISTLGTGRVPAFGAGNIKFQGEDILGFCMTNSGSVTAGTWHLMLDGSAEGMPKNSTDSISATADGETIYLTTKSTFNVDTATGGHSMVYVYDTTTGHFSGPGLRAPDNGLHQKVDGLHVEGSLP